MKESNSFPNHPLYCDLCGQPVDRLYKCILPEYDMVKVCLECFEDNNGEF